MKVKFSKYQGAGNDFVMIDNRDNRSQLSSSQIEKLCNRRYGVGADGLILLESSIGVDFQMSYYNADGLLGSMCGNGGRCVVAFAKQLGLIDCRCNFVAYDGLHKAELLETGLVALGMKDVTLVEHVNDAWKIDTGSPHLIFFTENVNDMDVQKAGAAIRNSPDFVEEGINVNFAERCGDALILRTYERGVEDETLACGTGATATVISACEAGIIDSSKVKVNALGGDLEVSFQKKDNLYTNVQLIGDAVFVYNGEINV